MRMIAVFVVLCCLQSRAQRPSYSIINELKGNGIMSRMGVMKGSSISPDAAIYLAHKFSEETGSRYNLARLAIFASESAAQRYESAKGIYHTDIGLWSTAQGEKLCPGLEAIAFGKAVTVRFCDSSGHVEAFKIRGADVFNWLRLDPRPTITYVSIWPGVHLNAEGTSPGDSIRVRFYAVSGTALPDAASGREMLRRFIATLKRPATLYLQISGRFVHDTFYPYVNPFFPVGLASIKEVASEPVLWCHVSSRPTCELVSPKQR